MKSLILEVRDRMTLIPVMATMLSSTSGENEYENKLMDRAGYGDPGLVLLTKVILLFSLAVIFINSSVIYSTFMFLPPIIY